MAGYESSGPVGTIVVTAGVYAGILEINESSFAPCYKGCGCNEQPG